jgi:hypothetical protein
MNFGNLGAMGGMVGNFLATPEGQEAAKKFLSSPDGVNLLKNFVGTPEGQKAILSILPVLLDNLNLTPEMRQLIKNAIPA